MALIDNWDRRALLLACVPVGAFVVLFARCLLPTSLGLDATLPFAGVMLISYGPLCYLALFRAWGDMEYAKALTPRDTTKARWWTNSTGSPWSRIGSHWLLRGATLWVAWFHWSLVSRAKEEIEPPEPGSLEAMLASISPGDVPTGLDLFGPALLIMGVLIPLLIVGLLWLLLPSRP
mgnify:CR=1 FL=1